MPRPTLIYNENNENKSLSAEITELIQTSQVNYRLNCLWEAMLMIWKSFGVD
jgi:hypothetical protein